MGEGPERGRGGGDGPGSSFDPAAGVRALADVQRRGLLAAGELVDRLVRTVDGDGNGRGDAGDDVARGGRARDAGDRPSDGDLVEAWLTLVRLGADLVGRMAGAAGSARDATVPVAGATLDVGAGRAAGSLRVTTADADGPTELWLHNGTGDEHAGIELHCGQLRTHDGGVLAAAAVRFDPAVVDLPGRSSRAVAVTAMVPDGTSAGVYRGVVQAAGIPDAWLPVEVDVNEPSDRLRT